MSALKSDMLARLFIGNNICLKKPPAGGFLHGVRKRLRGRKMSNIF